MAKKTNKPRLVTVEVASLLRRIKRTQDHKLVAVLANHLRDIGMPLAEQVLKRVDRHRSMADYWGRADMAGKKLSRPEHIRRWDKWLVSATLKLFGPVTTSTEPSAAKKVHDSVAELVKMRTRVKRLETAIEKRAKKTLAYARKRSPGLVVDEELSVTCSIGVKFYHTAYGVAVAMEKTRRNGHMIGILTPPPPPPPETIEPPIPQENNP